MTLPDPVFWRDRSVLVTGHTGFKGGWLALWLAHMGARVTGYALAPAVVDIPTAFSSEIPDDVALKLPRDIEDGAKAIRHAVDTNWRPNADARARWISDFRAFNADLADAIIPPQTDRA